MKPIPTFIKEQTYTPNFCLGRQQWIFCLLQELSCSFPQIIRLLMHQLIFRVIKSRFNCNKEHYMRRMFFFHNRAQAAAPSTRFSMRVKLSAASNYFCSYTPWFLKEIFLLLRL